MNSSHAYRLTLKTGVIDLKLERIISQDCHYSYLYSMHIIKGRFESGEEAISKNVNYSFYYAKYILKTRFRLGENSMISKEGSRDYFIKVMMYDHE